MNASARLQDRIRGLTSHIIAYRFELENERRRRMSRLTEKLKAAAAVAPRQALKLEARAERIIAWEPVFEAQADDCFGPHEALMAEAEKSTHDLKHQLAGFANASPLDLSSDSPEPRTPLNGQAGVGDRNEPKPAPAPPQAGHKEDGHLDVQSFRAAQ